jgi:hypothetical protein
MQERDLSLSPAWTAGRSRPTRATTHYADNWLQDPSETISTAPSRTLMAVWSSIA